MLVGAIDCADVMVWRMAFHADLLLRPRFIRDINGTIEVAKHRVVQLLYTIELGLEISSRTRSNMAFNTRDLSVGGVLGGHKLRLHRHVTTLTAEIHRLGVLIGFVTAERSQEEKADSADREQSEDSPVAFPRQ